MKVLGRELLSTIVNRNVVTAQVQVVRTDRSQWHATTTNTSLCRYSTNIFARILGLQDDSNGYLRLAAKNEFADDDE